MDATSSGRSSVESLSKVDDELDGIDFYYTLYISI